MYHRQITDLLDFVANINSVDKGGDFGVVVKNLLDVLADGFKLDRLFFVHQMTPSGLPEYILRNLSEKKCAEYREYYYKQDPFKILDGPPGEPRVRSWLMPRCKVMRLRELVEYSSFIATEYYNEFWRPQHIDNELGAFLVNDGRLLGYLGLYRKRGGGFLWEEEMQLLKLASPYITLTLENIILHHQIERIAADSVGQPLLMDPVFGLTHREEDIVRCLFDGLTNKEIADKLYISEITVKKHVQNICGKLGVNTRTAIISKILKSKHMF